MKKVLGDDKFEILHAFDHYFIVWDIFSKELKEEAVSYLLQGKNPFPFIKEKMQGELDAKGVEYLFDHRAFRIFRLKKGMEFENLIKDYRKYDSLRDKTHKQDHEWTIIYNMHGILENLHSFEEGDRNFRDAEDLESFVNCIEDALHYLKGSLKGLREVDEEGGKD